MRLVCPNCQAEYDVDDGAIPPAGRDVQCSACGHIWLQAPAGGWPEPDAGPPPEDAPAAPGADDTPGDDADEAAAAEPDAAPEPEPEPEPEPDAAPEPETPPEPRTEAGPDADSGPEPEDILAREAEADDTAQPDLSDASDRSPRRPAADPAALAILREEAEREAAARARERAGAPLEYQGELGLDSGRAAEPPIDEALAPAPRPTRPAKRGRDRLPDIDEFDTTLRPETADPRHKAAGRREAPQAQARPVPRLAHRAGFLLVIAGFAAATLVYARPEIVTDAMPGMAPRVEAYTAWIDGLRLRLDAGLRRSVVAIVSLVEQLRG